jgi:hypothetical protein
MKLCALSLLLLTHGCSSSHPSEPTDAGPPTRTDAGSDRDAGPPDAGRRPDADPGAPEDAGDLDAGPCVEFANEPVDLLFMVDNSNSMAEEQESLAMQFEGLVGDLSRGDLDPAVDADGDGDRNDLGDDFPPVGSLHVGVVTSDMGTGGFNVMTCSDEPNFGDDGILRTRGNTGIDGCRAEYPSFLEFSARESVPAFARDVGCVARAGTGGCGFEQPLEAVLKAVTPSTCTDPWCTFGMASRGHADGANDGFLRPDSVLAIVLLTDEEDCSVVDPDLFNSSSTRYSGELNLRCFLNPTASHPISRYVEGLLATRESPDSLVFGVIAGVPPDLAGAPFDEILDAPLMQEVIDPTMLTRLRPSCNVPGRGIAFPPRRLVSVARDLEAAGASSVVQSICDEDFSPIDGVIERVGRHLTPGVCR